MHRGAVRVRPSFPSQRIPCSELPFLPLPSKGPGSQVRGSFQAPPSAPSCVSVPVPEAGPGLRGLWLPADCVRCAAAAGRACVRQVRRGGEVWGPSSHDDPGLPLGGHGLGDARFPDLTQGHTRGMAAPEARMNLDPLVFVAQSYLTPRPSPSPGACSSFVPLVLG